MFITVAGEKKEVKDGLTLPELIAQENVEMPEYVTVSINEEFVASEDKESTVLKEGDQHLNPKKHREEVPNEKDRKNHEELRQSSHHGID